MHKQYVYICTYTIFVYIHTNNTHMYAYTNNTQIIITQAKK